MFVSKMSVLLGCDIWPYINQYYDFNLCLDSSRPMKIISRFTTEEVFTANTMIKMKDIETNWQPQIDCVFHKRRR